MVDLFPPRYQRDKDKPLEAPNNMKKLLGDFRHLTLRQKLAVELGLKDLVQSHKYDAGYMNDLQQL